MTETIRARRSIRKYKGDAIPQEHLKLILEAAMMAPSACNTRPWEFVVVTDPAAKQRLVEAHPHARHLSQAYAAIVVCARPDLQASICPGYFPQDCGAAVQNILLQAADLGYGTCWCGVYPREERMAAVGAALHIENAVPFALITLGVADETPNPRGFYDESRVTWL